MIAKTFVVCFLLVLGYNSFSQPDPVAQFNKHIVENWKDDYFRIGPYRVKGSPFLLGQSFPGTITYKGGKVKSNTKILYDLYNQKAGVETNNEIWESDTPVELFTITLPETMGNKSLVFANSYVFNRPDAKGFYNIIADGKNLALLKGYKSRLVTDPANQMAKDAKVFEQYFEYYIYNKTKQTLSNIKLRKKDIIKEIDADFLKSFLTGDVNLDFTNEAQVSRLINEFNAAGTR